MSETRKVVAECWTCRVEVCGHSAEANCQHDMCPTSRPEPTLGGPYIMWGHRLISRHREAGHDVREVTHG